MKPKILIKRMLNNPFFMTGLIVAIIIVLATFLSPIFLQFDPIKNSLTEKFVAPEYFSKGLSGHILGTDQLGRDIFARLLTGGRASLSIAACVVLIQLSFGTTMGLVSGYFGGAVDTIIMRVCDVILSIPNLVLAIAIMSVLGTGKMNLIIVLSFSGWVQYCKITRNNVRIAKNMEYVHASQVLGASKAHILFTQILPNVLTNIIIITSQQVGRTILLESSLSFLNLGIAAPTPSWGNIISDGRVYLTVYPWICMSAGIALMFTVLSFNFLGDGLRDVLDPKR